MPAAHEVARRARRGRRRRRPGGRLPQIATARAVPAEAPGRVDEGGRLRRRRAGAPNSLRIERLAARVVDDRDAPPGGGADLRTSRWGIPDASSSARELGAGRAARGREREHVVARSACSTRATFSPLPPARDAPVGTRCVAPGVSAVDVPGEVERRVRGDGEDHGVPLVARGSGAGEVACGERRAEQAGVVAELRRARARPAVEAEQRVEPLDRAGRTAPVPPAREPPPMTTASGATIATSCASADREGRRAASSQTRFARGSPAARARRARRARPTTGVAGCRRCSAVRWRRPRRWSRGIRSRRTRTARPCGRRASARSRPRSRRRACGRPPRMSAPAMPVPIDEHDDVVVARGPRRAGARRRPRRVTSWRNATGRPSARSARSRIGASRQPRLLAKIPTPRAFVDEPGTLTPGGDRPHVGCVGAELAGELRDAPRRPPRRCVRASAGWACDAARARARRRR